MATQPTTPNRALWRSLRSLIHPVTIGSIVLLVINDHVLKDQFASWWTGKLSDIAGLIFAPLICSVLLALIIPKSNPQQEKLVAIFAFGLTGLIFALSNTLPVTNHLTEAVWAYFVGADVQMWRDPSDLLTLPALLIGWRIWNRASNKPLRRPILQYAVLVGGLLAATATSCDDLSGIGIVCVYADGSTIVAVDGFRETGSNRFYNAYISHDDGQTWKQQSSSFRSPSTQAKRCSEPPNVRVELSNNNVMYRIIEKKSLQSSTDNGEYWEDVVDLRWITSSARHTSLISCISETDYGPQEIMVSSTTDTTFVAMGPDGLLVREAKTDWEWRRVGNYELDEPAQIEVTYKHLWIVALLGAVGGAIVSLVGVNVVHRNHLITAAAIWGWLLIVVGALSIQIYPNPTTYQHFVFWSFPITATEIIFIANLLIFYIVVVGWQLRYLLRQHSTNLLWPSISLGIIAFLVVVVPFAHWANTDDPTTFTHTKTISFAGLIIVQGIAIIYGGHRSKQVSPPNTGSEVGINA